MANAFYAVRVGRIPGIYKTWNECNEQVKTFSGAKYKKFKTLEEAQAFIDGVPTGVPPPVGGSGGVSVSDTDFDTQRQDRRQTSGPYTQFNGKDSFLFKSSMSRQPYRKFSTGRLRQSAGMSELSRSGLPELSKLSGSGVSKLPEGMSELSRSGVSKLPEGMSELPDLPKLPELSRSGLPESVRHDPDKVAVVYTDGCCHNNGQAGAVAGIGVYWGKNSPLNVAEPLPGRATNNRAEIHAAIKAILQAKSMGKTKIVVNTDSQFLINSVTLWIPTWMNNNWKLGGGGQVINREDFVTLLAAMKGIEVEWNHVRGHCGIVGNEEADRLANAGARKELPQPENLPFVF